MNNKDNTKAKLILMAILLFILMIGSIIIMIFTFMKTNNNNIITGEDSSVVIKDMEDKDNINNLLTEQIQNKNKLTTRYPLLNKYSEDYVSVAEWMLEQTVTAMNLNGFTVEVGDEENGWEEVDGLTVYNSASEYMTECLNTDRDIEDMFYYYCPELYQELSLVTLLGKDSNTEYDQTSSQLLEKTLLGYLEKEDYTKITEEIESLIETYKFTMPHNYKICRIYQDAKSMNNYKGDFEAIEYGLNYMQTTEAYFHSFMKLSDKVKMNYLVDYDSLVPYRNALISIKSIKELDLTNEYNWMNEKYFNSIRNAKCVYLIDYEEYNRDLEKSFKYIAYVARYYDGTHNTLKIEYNDEGTSLLFTMSDLKDMYMNKNHEDLPDGTIISQYGDRTSIPEPTEPNQQVETENIENNENVETQDLENINTTTEN